MVKPGGTQVFHSGAFEKPRRNGRANSADEARIEGRRLAILQRSTDFIAVRNCHLNLCRSVRYPSRGRSGRDRFGRRPKGNVGRWLVFNPLSGLQIMIRTFVLSTLAVLA